MDGCQRQAFPQSGEGILIQLCRTAEEGPAIDKTVPDRVDPDPVFFEHGKDQFGSFTVGGKVRGPAALFGADGPFKGGCGLCFGGDVPGFSGRNDFRFPRSAAPEDRESLG